MLDPSLTPSGPSAGEPWVFEVAGSKVAPSRGPGPSEGIFVGLLDGAHVWAVDAGAEVAGSTVHVDLMSLHGRVGEEEWLAAGRAVQLVEWTRNHRFCGRCGSPTQVSRTERALRCAVCGLAAFPRLAPAVITLIERDDGRVLLARNRAWPTAMFSCVAGFVEPGETLESAVRREVKEEVGVDVAELRYLDSQPWPFPHSLMIGFHARYAGGEVHVDGEEISEAAWFGPADLPQLPGRISIARRMIDAWLARS